MAFDDDLFQPHVSNRADYYRRVNIAINDGYTINSAAYGTWSAKELDQFLNSIMETDLDFLYIALNTWIDVQFFFKTEKDLSFFLLRFSEELAQKENIGYVK